MAARPDPLLHGRYWDATLNVVGGCEMPPDLSCYYCYAAHDAGGIQTALDVELYRGTTVLKHGRQTWTGRLNVLPPEHPTWTDFVFEKFRKPLLGEGKPAIYWLNSMADLFLAGHPPWAVDRILTTAAFSPHIGLVVTKHPGPMTQYFLGKPRWWRKQFILVISAGDQRWLERRWELVKPLAEAGWTIGVSLQPMLELIVLPPDFLRLARWCICGGEQSPGDREMDPDWARALLRQCKGADPQLAIFIKQMARGWLPPDLLLFRTMPGTMPVVGCGSAVSRGDDERICDHNAAPPRLAVAVPRGRRPCPGGCRFDGLVLCDPRPSPCAL